MADTELCNKLKGSFTTLIQAEKSMALDLFCPGKDQQSVLLFALQSFGTLREVGSGCRNTQAEQGKGFGNCGSPVERSASEASVGSSGMLQGGELYNDCGYPNIEGWSPT